MHRELRKALMTKEVIGGMSGQGLPYSKAYRAGNFVFVSGQVAFDEDGKLVSGDIGAQTRQVMHNIKTVLQEAGCTLADVVKTTVWLADTRDFRLFNKTYAEFFPENAPARSTVRADLMIDAKIELEVIACKP
jgi:reactive intermediate/imine deaminase